MRGCPARGNPINGVGRLRALMRPGHKGALALVLMLVLAALGVAGCGNNDPGKEADEGVPIQLGDLKLNVSETRFLNPNQPDDKQYLAGQQLPPRPSRRIWQSS